MAHDQVATIDREIHVNVEVLESLRAFYSTVPAAEFTEFASFVEPLLERHRTIKVLEWIPRVSL